MVIETNQASRRRGSNTGIESADLSLRAATQSRTLFRWAFNKRYGMLDL